MRCITAALLVTLFFANACAWNFRGHVLISQMAYNMLPPEKKSCLAIYISHIRDKLSPGYQKKLSSKYPNANLFAIASTFPDTWHDKTVTEIFQRFDAPLPTALKTYRNNTTTAWHFINHTYPYQCHMAHTPNAINMINLLQQAWQQTTNIRSRAVLLMLLAHLVGDIHQPLHTFSRSTRYCHIDYGGNNYYVFTGGKKRSLHYVWDSGLGYLGRQLHYPQQITSAKNTSRQETATPNAWANESLKYAAFVYSAPENQHINPAYCHRGQEIAKQRLALASKRLEKLLNQLCK